MIEVKNLHYAYPGNKGETIKGIGFSIEEGEIFGFLGPSGAGKTTTQKILIGILGGYRGKLILNGKNRREWGRELYEEIGVAFEFPNLYERFSAMENLSYFSAFYRNGTLNPGSLLALVGLEAEGKKKVEGFSKGMKIRLNFCRALLPDPKILFLDEPTAGLDPGNARHIRDIIRQQKELGKTVFLTTHNMSVAEDLCDRVAFLVDGQIILIDNPRDLRVKHAKKAVRIEYIRDGRVEAEDFDLTGIAHNRRFLNLLDSTTVERLYSLEPTLEDVFIKITGRSLE